MILQVVHHNLWKIQLTDLEALKNISNPIVVLLRLRFEYPSCIKIINKNKWMVV